MNRMAGSFALYISLLAFVSRVYAQPAAQPPATGPARIAEIEIPSDTVKLGDFLGLLQEKDPSFQYVLEPGPWQDIVLPHLHLRDVALFQVTGLLETLYPGLPVKVVGGGGSRPVLYVFGNAAMAGGPIGLQVQAFSLSSIVDHLAASRNGEQPKLRKQVVSELLSLIETTVRESASSGNPGSVSFHEPTETIIVKGTRDQIETVAHTLQTFRPNRQDEIDHLTAQLKEAQAQIDETHVRIDSLQQQLMKREQEEVDLRVRLEVAERKNAGEQKH